MPKRSLTGTILASREDLNRCRALYEELEESRRTSHYFQKYATTERQKEIVTELCNAFEDNHSEIWLVRLNAFDCFAYTHLWASEKALATKEKGITIGSKVLLGKWKTAAIVREIRWNRDLTVEMLDPRRKMKFRQWSPLEMELAPQSTDDAVIIEKIDDFWSAYCTINPSARSIGASREEAVGKLILLNPKQFDLNIQFK